MRSGIGSSSSHSWRLTRHVITETVMTELTEITAQAGHIYIDPRRKFVFSGIYFSNSRVIKWDGSLLQIPYLTFLQGLPGNRFLTQTDLFVN